MSLSRRIYQLSCQNLGQCKTNLPFQFHIYVGKRYLSTATGLRQAQHPNPGNFANRPKEELTEISRKGGKKGGRAKGVGGFHDMDPEKQHDIAVKGGRASRGSFTKGSKRTREAGRKGGKSRKREAVDDDTYSDSFE